MNADKKIFAQLVAEALATFQNEDALQDALWILNCGKGDAESDWEKFEQVFKEVFNISFDEARSLNYF